MSDLALSRLTIVCLCRMRLLEYVRKDSVQCCLLHIWQQVPISLPHFLGRMTDEVIDDSLVDACAGKVTDETVPQAVPAFYWCPTTVFERVCELGLDLAKCHLTDVASPIWTGECEWRSRMVGKPHFEYWQQLFADWNTAGGTFSFNSLSLADRDRSGREVEIGFA